MQIEDFNALLRTSTNSATRKKTMHRKECALAELGAVGFERVEDPQKIRQTLNAFFKQKSVRMCALGIADVFGAPSIRRFIKAASIERTPVGAPSIELYAVSVDDIVVADHGRHGRRRALLHHIQFHRVRPLRVIRARRKHCSCGWCAAVPSAVCTLSTLTSARPIKNLFCGDVKPLFDSFLPLTAKDHLVAAALSLGTTVKRAIKQRPALWTMAQQARRPKARFSAGC